MFSRVRQIVASLANNPALLQLLREDPKSFSQQLGLSETETQALNGASDLLGKWAVGFLAEARSMVKSYAQTTSTQAQEAPSTVEPPAAIAPVSAESTTSEGNAVPIVSVVGLLGLVGAVGTVGTVALAKSDS
jgi:hypothetical protein